MANEIFIDWLTISQLHTESEPFPIFTGGINVDYDPLGNARFERVRPANFKGSFETSLRIKSDGRHISLSGNVGRFSRKDNLFNAGWEDTLRKCNRGLLARSLPAFHAGKVLNAIGKGDIPGARVSRIDLTANFATGSESQARHLIRWLATRSVSRKGNFASDLVRNVAVEVPRIGKAVRTVAVAGGPVGMAISAVSLICELTTICNDAGQWMMGADPALEGFPSTTPNYKWSGFGSETFPNPNTACNSSAYMSYVSAVSSSPVMVTETTYNCKFKDSLGNNIDAYTNRSAGCPANYVFNGTECVLQGNSQARVPTATDWDAKESLLNDQRFIDPLMEKGQPVPVGSPTITTPQKVPIGSETKTMKDASGNVTGTETTTTEAEISQPSSAENPTGSPSVIKVVENNTVNNYNTSNQLTSSTSTVSSNAVPVQQKQEQITITIDNVPDVPLQTKEVPGTFSFTSWGSGTCPADKSWNTMFGTHTFSYQLTCDFAAMAKPIILLIAAIVSFMIIASIRTDT